MRQIMLRMQSMLVIVLASGLLVSAASSLELVMFRRTGCPWCTAWDREVGPVYAKTAIGQRAPLRRLDLDRDPVAPLKLTSPIRYTPTFVLLEGNREIDRIEGYPGEDFFWARLERLGAFKPTNSD